MVATKYIFVTGGVVSSLDKGIMVSMLARVLQFRGFGVTIGKFDSCLNIDYGALNPNENGECFITGEGDVVSQVLGCYERYADIETTCDNHITMGQIYRNVLDKECRGDYVGELVSITPHVTDEIMRKIKALGSRMQYDFVIVEIGGNMGSIDNFPYVEAVRRFKSEQERDSVCIYLKKVSEEAFEEYNSIVDIVFPLHEGDFMREIRDRKLDEEVLNKLGVVYGDRYDSAEWEKFENRKNEKTEKIEIGVVCKNADSVVACEAVKASVSIVSVYNDVVPAIRYISSGRLNSGNVDGLLNGVDGIIIASDSNTNGIEGKIVALKWCREKDIPTLAIGQGMQCMVIEYARNVAGLQAANSTEMDRYTPYNVIDVMSEQKKISIIGSTMRIGAYRSELFDDSVVMKAYGKKSVYERHHHVYELNNNYREWIETVGMKCTGVNPETNLVDVVEVPERTWYVGAQFHPEYNCSVLRPNPLLKDFVRATKEKKKK